MKTKPIALLPAMAFVAALMTGTAHAQNIDTTTAWDGSNTLSGFGSMPTFGQTITVPAGYDRLTGFSFYIDAMGHSRPFRAAVYAWDVTQQHAVGSPLWQSAPVAITGADGTVLEYAFAPPGGVPVTPGGTYVLLGTTLYDGGSGTPSWGFLQTNAYSGGGFVYLGSMNSALLTGTAWADMGVWDLVFKAAFASPSSHPVQATPVPSLQGAALALLGLALAGAALLFIHSRYPGAPKP